MVLPFPPDCPPADAVSMAGTFYRLAVRGLAVNDSTTPACWLRPYETRKGDLYGKEHECAAHGLSLFESKDDLDEARDINPRIAAKPVAAVSITTADGVLKHTPTDASASHHDWWTEPYDLIPEATIIEAPREVA
ncbi:hypothetical protein BC477_03030 [Clavibacter michiganensis subsp. michiganensis]|uniref:Uncharacterized protein n=3 Tax=Clavibacter michiganensis TaxID=28447 RepID=A0A251XJI2_CLAMM|nr:hypothetical protein [Clavibacter michiganensis]MWJ14243.1 hypothetical protein [Clavibacter michiganensis subsp. michiganensis]OUD86942.1 hypothetical protein BC477_03030 [Clavibacter michiganensis subsp. michiganensis]OUE03685.1 hypothetical protein CMMCAS07_01965 [Clavibacter michiganensis subsp. michiganensis]